ncbi:MAG: DNA repair protein RadC [Desulfobacteraceae bacterium]|nr:MAG: DNA repair protein RadC [Desulfobacteraceae bacterium]
MEKEQWQKRGTGHRNRMRERFMEGGLERFSDEEVVEFLLTLGTPRGDLKIPAREAIERFGGLAATLSAPIEKLTEIKGIGQKNALYLSLVHQIASRYLRDRVEGKNFFTSSRDVFDYLFHVMRDLSRETFKVLLLSRKNQLIADKDLFSGTLTESAVYPREIIATALEHKAASLIFVHNHPSGDPAPSAADHRITRDLTWASRLMGIQVLDHIIIGRNTYYSFADTGHIGSFTKEFEEKLPQF